MNKTVYTHSVTWNNVPDSLSLVYKNEILRNLKMVWFLGELPYSMISTGHLDILL